MITFIIGLVILFVGAAVYGAICEKVFGPDDRQTPAYSKQDGVDYVPMPKWKNMLINLLNIAGTGPIFGPIQGILFGPIAFITIPIGNIIGGAMHDYFSGMICLRDGGSQMSSMIHKYSNKGIYRIYNVFVCLLLLLVGAGIGVHPDKIMIGNIMLVIPGIQLTTSLRDMINGDTISGLLNLSEAILKAISVALGFALVLLAGGV